MINLQSERVPEIPVMSDINDLFANLDNNWFHMRYVLALMVGIIFAFFLAKKLLRMAKGDDDD